MANGPLWLDDLPWFTHWNWWFSMPNFTQKQSRSFSNHRGKAQHQNPTLVVLPSAHAYSSESPVNQRGKTTSSSSCTHLSRLTHSVLIYAYRYDNYTYTYIPASSTVCVLFAFSGTSASLDLGNTYIYIYICIYICVCVCVKNMYRCKYIYIYMKYVYHIRLRLSAYVHANKIK